MLLILLTNTDAHMQVVERISYYLKRNPSKRLLFMRYEGINNEGCSDADCASSIDSRSSTKRQIVCVRLSAEAEYHVIDLGCYIITLVEDSTQRSYVFEKNVSKLSMLIYISNFMESVEKLDPSH